MPEMLEPAPSPTSWICATAFVAPAGFVLAAEPACVNPSIVTVSVIGGRRGGLGDQVRTSVRDVELDRVESQPLHSPFRSQPAACMLPPRSTTS